MVQYVARLPCASSNSEWRSALEFRRPAKALDAMMFPYRLFPFLSTGTIKARDKQQGQLLTEATIVDIFYP